MKTIDNPFPEEADATPARDPKNEKRLALRDEDQIVFLMNNPLGRGFVWDQLSAAGVFHSSFAGEATHATAFAEGKRQAGLDLLMRVLQYTPDFYLTMTKEANTP